MQATDLFVKRAHVHFTFQMTAKFEAMNQSMKMTAEQVKKLQLSIGQMSNVMEGQGPRATTKDTRWEVSRGWGWMDDSWPLGAGPAPTATEIRESRRLKRDLWGPDAADFAERLTMVLADGPLPSGVALHRVGAVLQVTQDWLRLRFRAGIYPDAALRREARRLGFVTGRKWRLPADHPFAKDQR